MKRWSVLFVMLIIGLSGIFYTDYRYRQEDAQENQVALQEAAKLVEERLNKTISNRLNVVDALRGFLLAQESVPDQESFNRYAKISLENYPSIGALEYADERLIIRYVYPLEGNEAALNHALLSRAVNVPFVEKAMRERRMVVSDPFMTLQGFQGIVVRAPLYRETEFVGLAQEVFNIDLVVEQALAVMQEQYTIELLTTSGAVFWRSGETGSLSVERAIAVGDNVWLAKVDWRTAPQISYFILALIWSVGLLLLSGVMIIVNQSMMREKKLREAVLEKTRSLAVSEERYRAIFENSGTALMFIEEDRRISLINKEFEKLSGYRKAEIEGRVRWDIFVDDPFELARMAEYHQLRRKNDKQAPLSYEFILRDRAGVRKNMIVTVAVLPGTEQSLAAFVDISTRKAAEQALAEANERLETKVAQRTQELTVLNEDLQAMNQALLGTLDKLRQTQGQLVQAEKMAGLGMVVVGVAHELNTPIGLGVTLASHMEEIIGNLLKRLENGKMKRNELFEDLNDSAEAARMLLYNLQRAGQLVKSFKQVSLEEFAQDRRLFLVQECLDDALISLRERIAAARLHVVLECDRNLCLDGSPSAFLQMISNLILNSLVHGYAPGESGEIKIKAVQLIDRLLLTYTDDGRGIDEELMPRIFDPFVTACRGAGNMGLGLYVLHNIVVQEFGGTVEGYSEPGCGVKFVIDLPLRRDKEDPRI
ncbi:ATP-binding protein [Azotosporobacter soli]|uniref:ATP-binding protein n=1 Tax=Azotosporobacter soli TaxID=3055040 RepID=UPI0031FF3493